MVANDQRSPKKPVVYYHFPSVRNDHRLDLESHSQIKKARHGAFPFQLRLILIIAIFFIIRHFLAPAVFKSHGNASLFKYNPSSQGINQLTDARSGKSALIDALLRADFVQAHKSRKEALIARNKASSVDTDRKDESFEDTGDEMDRFVSNLSLAAHDLNRVKGKTSMFPDVKPVENTLFDNTNYSKPFHYFGSAGYNPDNKYSTSFLWRYDQIEQQNITGMVFKLGKESNDYINLYKPFCIDRDTEKGITFEGETLCNGLNENDVWFKTRCEFVQGVSTRDHQITIDSNKKPSAWQSENKKDIQWVEGLTFIHVLDRSCGNIAHFNGRILALFHLIENAMAYSHPPRNPANILIIPSPFIIKRFESPGESGQYQSEMLRGLIWPLNYSIGSLSDFVSRASSRRPQYSTVVHLTQNFSKFEPTDKRYICFRRVLVPSFLRGRFFVDDYEYPSTRSSIQSSITNSPYLPRDSLRLREKLGLLMHGDMKIERATKQVMLFDRNLAKRRFIDDSRQKVLDVMKKIADEHGYTFSVSSFEGRSFKEQYDMTRKVAIGVGIHGANLVNSMFMPPFSVLFEIFPFGFNHKMYKDGGNSGLRYVSYEMKNGIEFEGVKSYESREECIKMNNQCKVFYRDQDLNVTIDDLKEMENILRESIKWFDSLP